MWQDCVPLIIQGHTLKNHEIDARCYIHEKQHTNKVHGKQDKVYNGHQDMFIDEN